MPLSTLDIEDPQQLRQYLVRRNFIAEADPLAVETLPGGVSNRTVYLRHGPNEYVIKQALSKLRVQVDWFSDPRRIHHEALGLAAISSLVPGATPELVFEDQAEHLLAMRAVSQPHENWKSMLLRAGPEPRHVRRFALLLAMIHRGSFYQRDALQQTFADRSFFESLRIEPYYQFTASQLPQAAPFLEELVARTRATSLALVHGDYSPKNILVQQEKLILLDHEVIHWGDPAFDIGFSTTHLLSKAHHSASRRAAFVGAAQAYWDWYHHFIDVPWAREIEEASVRHTLACLLARCRGRSPLEYLDARQRTHQADIVVEMMKRPPAAMPALINAFSERL
jgi:aminoglycoside phosphotransferase (APT) family kinase protein